jgi:hypothetical protein
MARRIPASGCEASSAKVSADTWISANHDEGRSSRSRTAQTRRMIAAEAAGL